MREGQKPKWFLTVPLALEERARIERQSEIFVHYRHQYRRDLFRYDFQRQENQYAGEQQQEAHRSIPK